MARGWESKAVESQIEDAASEPMALPQESPGERDRRRKIADLSLSRIRIAREMAEARQPGRQAQMAAALAHLDARIHELEGDGAGGGPASSPRSSR